MTAIRTEELTRKFKDRIAVDSLSLRVEKGEFFALLQSSACFVAALFFGLPLTAKT